MNANDWNALCFLAGQDEPTEIDLASPGALGVVHVLGHLVTKGLADVRPGKESPAYTINREGLAQIGIPLQ